MSFKVLKLKAKMFHCLGGMNQISEVFNNVINFFDLLANFPKVPGIIQIIFHYFAPHLKFVSLISNLAVKLNINNIIDIKKYNTIEAVPSDGKWNKENYYTIKDYKWENNFWEFILKYDLIRTIVDCYNDTTTMWSNPSYNIYISDNGEQESVECYCYATEKWYKICDIRKFEQHQNEQLHILGITFDN